MESMEAFRIEHASVRRDGKYILSDVSLSLELGSNIAIIGPNGAGKSTIVDVITRSTYPLCLDEYRSSVLGSERWLIHELRKRISIVSQASEQFFNTTYTAREITASGLYASLGFDFHHRIDDQTWKKADEELGKVGMLEKAGRAMNSLSTGEKRRVLLARAAITKPSLLFLDEASNGLDFPARADLRETIRTFASPERSIVMVTHELAEIIPEIDRIILMKDGRIVKDGSKEECLRGDVLSDLYGRDVTVVCRDGIYSSFC